MIAMALLLSGCIRFDCYPDGRLTFDGGGGSMPLAIDGIMGGVRCTYR
jgi:hypothetical protein